MISILYVNENKRIIELDISNSVFERFDNQLSLGTRLNSPNGNATVFGWAEDKLWIQFDGDHFMNCYSNIKSLKDLQRKGLIISSAPFSNYLNLTISNSNNARQTIAFGANAFTAFENKIKLGTTLKKSDNTSVVVLGCDNMDGTLVMQIKGERGAYNDKKVKNFSQLIDNGYDFSPNCLEDLVKDTIVKKEIEITNITSSLPEDFFNRIQTIFQQKKLVNTTPRLFSAIQQQALITTVVELEDKIKELQSTCQVLAAENKQLQEKLNAKENLEHGTERKRRYSMF